MNAWIFLAGFCLVSSAQALTVEEAYRAIPHGRTVFDSRAAQMNKNDVAYLEQLFAAVDLAIVAKVEAGLGKQVAQAYAPVEPAWSKLKAPAPLRAVQEDVYQAIKKQRAYLEKRRQTGAAFNSADPLVRESSGRLHQAYGELLRVYSNENAHNKRAFFDYLCALDFI